MKCSLVTHFSAYMFEVFILICVDVDAHCSKCSCWHIPCLRTFRNQQAICAISYFISTQRCCSSKLLVHSLRFDHHSGIDNIKSVPFVVIFVTGETWTVTSIEPPPATTSDTTIITRCMNRPVVIIVVICREHHSIVKVPSKLAVPKPVAFIHEWVASVSAVAVHFQSVFVVELVADLERPVLVADLEWPVLITDLDQYWLLIFNDKYLSPIWNDQYLSPILISTGHWRSVTSTDQDRQWPVLVADLEWPVLVWEPDVWAPLLYLKSEAVRLAVG